MYIYHFREPFFHRCLPKEIIDNPLSVAELVANATQVNSIIDSFTSFFGQYRFFNELAASFYMVRWDILILMATALGRDSLSSYN